MRILSIQRPDCVLKILPIKQLVSFRFQIAFARLYPACLICQVCLVGTVTLCWTVQEVNAINKQREVDECVFTFCGDGRIGYD